MDVLSIVESIMEKVTEELVVLNGSSANPLGTCNLIRESCTVSAIAITKAAFGKMTEEKATEEIERVHKNTHKIGRALGAITPTDQKLAICTIWADSVRKATEQAASNNRGHRVNGWVFAISAMINGAASNIIMELHYS